MAGEVVAVEVELIVVERIGIGLDDWRTMLVRLRRGNSHLLVADSDAGFAPDHCSWHDLDPLPQAEGLGTTAVPVAVVCAVDSERCGFGKSPR